VRLQEPPIIGWSMEKIQVAVSQGDNSDDMIPHILLVCGSSCLVANVDPDCTVMARLASIRLTCLKIDFFYIKKDKEKVMRRHSDFLRLLLPIDNGEGYIQRKKESSSRKKKGEKVRKSECQSLRSLAQLEIEL